MHPKRLLWTVPVIGLLLVASIALAGKSGKRLGDDERGKQLYERHCVQCHGAQAAGDGAATAALVAAVPDLRGKLTEKNRDEMAEVVVDGRGVMPGFEASFDEYDARRVLRYMEKQGRKGEGAVTKPVAAPPAETDEEEAAGADR